MEYYNINANQFASCVIDNGAIYSTNLYGQKEKIGVTNETHEELKKIADSYYKKLVELGAIIPPKSPEELQSETLAIIKSLSEQVALMRGELNDVKSKYVGKPIECQSTTNADGVEESTTSIAGNTD